MVAAFLVLGTLPLIAIAVFSFRALDRMNEGVADSFRATSQAIIAGDHRHR